MIDLETLSLRPDAFVVQVGYAMANLETGEDIYLPVNIWMDDAGQKDRHIDLDTVRWWMHQDDHVKKSVFKTQHPRNLRSPTWLFDHFSQLLRENKIDEVWAAPAMFDLPILTSLWGGVKPWEYNQERCMMTLRQHIDPNRELAPAPNKMAHDAASDAQWQLQYLKALRAIYLV